MLLPDSNGIYSESDTGGTTGCYTHQGGTPSTTGRPIHQSVDSSRSLGVLLFLVLTPYHVGCLGAK